MPETGDILTDDMVGNEVWNAMQKAFDPVTNLVRDLKIDDSDIPNAKNFYDFCANHAGKSVKMPFARQQWIAMNLFGEVCNKCTHPKAQDFWNIPVDLEPHILNKKSVYLEWGVCPKCKSTKFELIKQGLLHDYTELVLIAGQRAGKSALTAAMTNYAIHRLLKSPKLSTIARGIQDFTPLVGSFVALTTTKATALLWNPVRDMIAASKWFEDYFKMLDFYGKKYGREFYQFKPTGTYLRFFHKSLDLLPEGPSKRTLRGATRFWAATDELGHFPFDAKSDQDDFDDERERANADEVHQVLSNSLLTVRTEVASFYAKGIYTVPQALNLSISSPASWKDKICRLYKESEASTQMLGVKAATWEISPIYTEDHPNLVDMRRRNPRKFERDFGANPPSLSSTVFNKDTILPLFCLDPLYAVNYDNSVDKTRGKAVELTHPAIFYPSIMGLDAGYTNNAFGLTITYQTPEGLVKCPIAIEVIPAVGKKIDFVYLYEHAIKPVIKACNVKAVVADRWNSIHVLQSIETDFPTVKTAIYSLRAKDFSAFTELVNAGQLLMPKLELPPDRIEVVTDYKKDLMRFPASHLYLQFLTVQEIQGMLDKGSGYTDDIFRALVISSRHHFDKRISEHLAQYKPIEREAMSLDSIIIVSGRSMGMYR